MSERRQHCQVHFEYCFDLLFGAKLEQVYDILVPDSTRRTGGHTRAGGHGHEDSGDLCAGVVRPAERGQTIASQTAALTAFASSQGYSVPAEWIFEDEGFSGATLVRPGLERVRDLVGDGQIQAVLVLSPDRLSRKYAYQVLLTEEWLRNGVETIFVKAPQSHTPEDQLLLQFQGMIAEYERAQCAFRRT